MTRRALGNPWRPVSALAAVLLSAVLAPHPVAACAVCFGAAESETIAGLQAGILLLLVIVGVVFAGVGAFLVAARRRVRRLAGQSTEAP